MSDYAKEVIHFVENRNEHQPEFVQAVKEVLNSISPLLNSDQRYKQFAIVDRIIEPERTITFRVTWMDDSGKYQVNRGYRVQFNSAIGPYKGGLRFHPSVNMSILKFLGFEQIFKNALTGLPLGGGKGGSDFDPKGKSDAEVMRFCQAFMRELYRHIGPNVDIPAGDIGVGAREIGYLFGQYKKIVNSHDSVMTGKGLNWGGSLIRPEATGYGNVYFANEMLKTIDQSFDGKRVLVSGSGNVAQYTVEKAIALGAKVLSMSDSHGCIIDEDGIDQEKLEWIKDLKNVKRGRIKEYIEKFPSAQYYEGNKPWGIVDAEVVLPSATQNEITLADANTLLLKGAICVSEGSNMSSTPEAIETFQNNKILFAPGKAANAGGVATSGLEMSQNAIRLSWSREEVDNRLHDIMVSIHKTIQDTADEFGVPGNYVTGANIAGFKKVADAMIDLGL